MFDPVEITRLHQFGSASPSSNYDEHVRPSSAPTPTITYSMSDFMTSGAGRYAYPSLFPVIREFFEDTTLEDNVYSFADLELGLGWSSSDLEINISNYSTGILSSDHAVRSYIFGNSKFKITFDPGATFVVNGDNRSISGFTITALTDNFDFESTPGSAQQLFSDLVLEGFVDPYGLARDPVTINFDNSSGASYASYDQDNFALSDDLDEVVESVSAAVGIASIAANGGIGLVNSLSEDQFLGYEAGDYGVVYGTFENDTLAPQNFANNTQNTEVFQFALFGGDGADDIRGGINSDVIFGGDGADFIRSGSGNDYINGGDGGDRIVAGDGFDTVYFGGTQGIRLVVKNPDLTIGTAGEAAGDRILQAEAFVGTTANDRFIADPNSVTFFAGNDGDDRLILNKDNPGTTNGVTVAFGGAGRDVYIVENAGQILLANIAGLTEENFGEINPDLLSALLGGPLEDFDLIVLNPDSQDRLRTEGTTLSLTTTSSILEPLSEAEFAGVEVSPIGLPLPSRETFNLLSPEYQNGEVAKVEIITDSGSVYDALTLTNFYSAFEEAAVYYDDGAGELVLGPLDEGDWNSWQNEIDLETAIAKSEIVRTEDMLFPLVFDDSDALEFFQFLEVQPLIPNQERLAIVGDMINGRLIPELTVDLGLSGVESDYFDFV